MNAVEEDGPFLVLLPRSKERSAPPQVPFPQFPWDRPAGWAAEKGFVGAHVERDVREPTLPGSSAAVWFGGIN